MRRAPLAALALALGLAAAPALAADCTRVTDRVSFCPEGTSWNGIAGEFVQKLHLTTFRTEDTVLMLGVPPDFARDAWDGTTEGLVDLVASFADEGTTVLEPPALDDDRPLATAAFAPHDNLVILLSVLRSGDELILAQTARAGTAVTDEQRAAHDAALASLVEVGL